MYLAHATPETLAKAAVDLKLGPGWVLGVLIAEEGRPDLHDVVRALRAVDASFFGGLFPGLILGDRSLKTGALLVPLPSATPPILIRGLDQPRLELADLALGASSEPGSQTALVLVDGLTANISRLLTALHGRLGNSVHYIGGGAGSLSLQQEPCVFTRDGVYQDAAVVTFVAQRSRLGVRHGWKQLDGPMIATRTRGNVIHELNWCTAFDVYRDAVEPLLEQPLTHEGFFAVSAGFPFGIYKEGGEDVVRDPVSIGASGALICVGEVPENAVLNVLRGDRQSLIAAAAQAAADCCDAGPVQANYALVIDCVSRTMFMAEDFEKELGAVCERLATVAPDAEVHGMLSLGEISSQDGVVEFYNKTIVAAVLHD